MSYRLLALTASLLALGAGAPAAASADVDLGGAPTLRVLDSDHAQLRFASDALDRKANGAYDVRITVAGHTVRGLRRAGRHGRDVVYTGRVQQSNLRVGQKYTVRFKIAGQADIVRLAKLRPQR